MKKQILISVGILVIGIISAIGIGISNADFIVPEPQEPTRYSGEITFLADGKLSSCYLDEPNMDIDDDFEECLYKNFAGKRITNVKDWTNREYKQVEIKGKFIRSFDEDKLSKLNETSSL